MKLINPRQKTTSLLIPPPSPLMFRNRTNTYSRRGTPLHMRHTEQRNYAEHQQDKCCKLHHDAKTLENKM